MMFYVLMAYIDETGDTGDPSRKGSSSCYGLGCLLIEDVDWAPAFDTMIEFRRRLSDTYGIPARAELKANHLIRGGGALAKLNLAPAQRSLIYRAHLNMLTPLKARAFGIVIDKDPMLARGYDIFDVAWETLLQRLERTSTYENKPFMITHDAGENERIRRQVRKARRHLTAGSRLGTGVVRTKAQWLIDDPVPRDSSQSYFVQLADMTAYAAWRSYMAPSPNVAKVAPSSLWNEVGAATHTPVNKYSGGVPGVVVRKK